MLAIFAFQVFENIGMTMGIMPITGIPLPFMSYGGSAIITSFIAVGLVANVNMRRFSYARGRTGEPSPTGCARAHNRCHTGRGAQVGWTQNV